VDRVVEVVMSVLPVEVPIPDVKMQAKDFPQLVEVSPLSYTSYYQHPSENQDRWWSGDCDVGVGVSYAHSFCAAAANASVNKNILELARSINTVYSFPPSASKIVNSISFLVHVHVVP
jgi:hypothetical protein